LSLFTWLTLNKAMASDTSAKKAPNFEAEPRQLPVHEKNTMEDKNLECTPTSDLNLVYDDLDEEPELHASTYLALAAMFFLNLVQVFALQGPPAVVCFNESKEVN
jgi:hypothetical protein